MVNTLVLAGSQPITGKEDEQNKALLQINGRAMIEYVIDAIDRAAISHKTIVVGPHDELGDILENKTDGIVEGNGSIMDNIRKGIKYLGNDRRILICASDIPLITPQSIQNFVERAEQSGNDFCYPIIEKRVNSIRFPEMERTYVKLKQGIFTGGNVFYMSPEVADKGLFLGDRLIRSRKNPLAMAGIFGPGLMLRMLTGTLSIENVEKRVLKLTGIKAGVIVTEYAELGNDVDKASDVAAAEAYLTK